MRYHTKEERFNLNLKRIPFTPKKEDESKETKILLCNVMKIKVKRR